MLFFPDIQLFTVLYPIFYLILYRFVPIEQSVKIRNVEEEEFDEWDTTKTSDEEKIQTKASWEELQDIEKDFCGVGRCKLFT